VFAIVVGLGLVLGQFLGSDEEPGTLGTFGPLVGKPAPAASLIGFDEEAWTLEEHLASDGRPVLLNLWASWCAPCRFEIPELSEFADAHPEIFVVGIAVDDTFEAAEDLANELKPRYQVGLDMSGDLFERYTGFGLPMTFLIDSDGIVRRQLMGGVTRAQLEQEIEPLSSARSSELLAG